MVLSRRNGNPVLAIPALHISAKRERLRPRWHSGACREGRMFRTRIESRWIWPLAIGLVSLLAPTVFASTAPAASGSSAPRIGHAGRWFVDAQGRVLIFHGGN